MATTKHHIAGILAGAVAGIALIAAIETAEAQTLTASQYCNAMANYAEAVALDRDNGALEFQALEIAAREPHPKLRSDYILLVHIIHSQPHQEPIKEAGTAFELCWAAHGGE